MNARWTLGDAARAFVGFTSPRVLIATVALLVPLRLALGAWTLLDLVVPLAMVAVHPFTEWLIHVFLLHAKPRKLGPWTLDTVAARDHRRHHQDPAHLPLVFIPLPTLAAGGLLIPLLAFLLAPTWTLGLTVFAWASCMALFYEWTHYVCHSPWVPEGAFFKSRIRHHRLHHYKNERYWYGVTLHLGDRVLRTRPDADRVERSPTARALHGDVQRGG